LYYRLADFFGMALRNLRRSNVFGVAAATWRASRGRPRLTAASRWSSSVLVTPSSVDGVARVTLARAPANTFTLEFFGELQTTLDELEADPTVQGIVFTSSSPKIFCAGTLPYSLRGTRCCFILSFSVAHGLAVSVNVMPVHIRTCACACAVRHCVCECLVHSPPTFACVGVVNPTI
jgi:hypothetical protein